MDHNNGAAVSYKITRLIAYRIGLVYVGSYVARSPHHPNTLEELEQQIPIRY